MASREKQEYNNTDNKLSSSPSSNGSTKQNEFDKIRAEAFARKMLDILNGGTVSLMISIGHQTCLISCQNYCHQLA
jgi:hypothetical protein